MIKLIILAIIYSIFNVIQNNRGKIEWTMQSARLFYDFTNHLR